MLCVFGDAGLPGEGIRLFSGAGVVGSCEPLQGCLHYLEEQKLCLTNELFLQTQERSDYITT